MAVAPQELWAHSTWPTGDPKEWLETPNQSMNEQLAMNVMLSKEPPVLTTIGFPPTWVKTQSRAIWPLAAVSKWRAGSYPGTPLWREAQWFLLYFPCSYHLQL